MNWKYNFKISLYLTILISLLMIFVNEASPQSSVSRDDAHKTVIRLEMSLEDLKRIDELAQKYPILERLNAEKDKIIAELQTRLELERKINELNQKEIDLQRRIIEVKNMEIEAQKRAFADMKEIADRALKLAESQKPKPNWELQGLLGLTVFVIGFVLGR